MNQTVCLQEYDNFVFDLYGTLIDTRADRESFSLWSKMAQLYAVYGADYTAAGLRREYGRLVKEEQRKLIAETGCHLPEIKIENVFMRLLSEAKKTHKTAHAVDKSMDEIVYGIASFFRVLMRSKMNLFPAVPELLQHLRDKGKGVYLLSNAMAILTRPEIEQLRLAPCFDDIFLSSDFGVKKPNSLFFEKLLQKHSLDPAKTIMVGNDFTTDMGIALACGTAGAHINSDKLSVRERAKRKRALADTYGKDTDRIFEFQSIRCLYNAVCSSVCFCL